MAADPEKESGSQPATTTNYKQRALKTLDRLVEDWQKEEYRKAELTPPKLAAEAGINYNTWHKNGVTEKLVAEINCLQYRKWSGFKIIIEKYVEERGLEQK